MKTPFLALAACAALGGCAASNPDAGSYASGYVPPPATILIQQTPGYYPPGYYYGDSFFYGGRGPFLDMPRHRVDGRRRSPRDIDGDGAPNRLDRDRDGDGVPNRLDRRPNNPRRS